MKHSRGRPTDEEVGKQAVYSLLGLLHTAEEIAKLLPPEPSQFRQKVLEALGITEIALLRFKMEMNFGDGPEDDDIEVDIEELH